MPSSSLSKPLPQLPSGFDRSYATQTSACLANSKKQSDRTTSQIKLLKVKASLLALLPHPASVAKHNASTNVSEAKLLPYTAIETPLGSDPRSEDVADRNIDRQTKFPPRTTSSAYVEPLSTVRATQEKCRQPQQTSRTGNSKPLMPSDDLYSMHVANWNILQNRWGLHGRLESRRNADGEDH